MNILSVKECLSNTKVGQVSEQKPAYLIYSDWHLEINLRLHKQVS